MVLVRPDDAVEQRKLKLYRLFLIYYNFTTSLGCNSIYSFYNDKTMAMTIEKRNIYQCYAGVKRVYDNVKTTTMTKQ